MLGTWIGGRSGHWRVGFALSVVWWAGKRSQLTGQCRLWKLCMWRVVTGQW